MHRIARRSGYNKRMLYHYFGAKNDLYRAVLQHNVSAREELAQAAPMDPYQLLLYWQNITDRNRDFVRLLEWEALTVGEKPTVAERERRQAYQLALSTLRKARATGLIPRDWDVAQTLLLFVAITFFPVAFPQISRQITGKDVDSPAFRKERLQFLQQFAAHLREESPKENRK